MDAIHELMGGTGSVGGNEARQHVNKVFETMDLNQDGTISMEEFMAYCTSHQDVTESLTVFNIRLFHIQKYRNFFNTHRRCIIVYFLNQILSHFRPSTINVLRRENKRRIQIHGVLQNKICCSTMMLRRIVIAIK